MKQQRNDDGRRRNRKSMEQASRRNDAQEGEGILQPTRMESVGRRRGGRRTASFMAAVLGIAAVLFWPVYLALRQERLGNALLTAIRQKKSAAVTALLEQGADSNARESHYVSLSLWQRLTNLFDRMSNSTEGQNREASALTLAVEQDDTVSVRALLARGGSAGRWRRTGRDGALACGAEE